MYFPLSLKFSWVKLKTDLKFDKNYSEDLN